MSNGSVQSTCAMCFIKHYSAATAFYKEVVTGYPEHMLYLIGELDLAETESREKYPEVAKKVQCQRRQILYGIDTGNWDEILAVGTDFLPTFIESMKLMGETFIPDHKESNANKVLDIILVWQSERSQDALSMGR